MRYQGTITRWKDDQGFGFITPEGGGEPVFIHFKAFANRKKRPAEGVRVTYTVTQDAKGRPRAEQASFMEHGKKAAPARSREPGAVMLLVAGLFLLFITASALVGKLPLSILGLYLLASLVAFVAYAMDKSAAQKEQWRTPENTLHLLGLIGGWPGALVAQQLLRHKTSKPSFRVVFWATVVLNCGGLFWLQTPGGATVLRSLLGSAA